MADGRYARAELLAALWRLGGDPDERMPVSHGILDRALQGSREVLPDVLRDSLSFGVTSVGLRCYELPGLLLAAEEAEIVETSPTCGSALVAMDEDAARQTAVRHGLSTRRAREVGAELRAKAAEARRVPSVASLARL